MDIANNEGNVFIRDLWVFARFIKLLQYCRRRGGSELNYSARCSSSMPSLQKVLVDRCLIIDSGKINWTRR